MFNSFNIRNFVSYSKNFFTIFLSFLMVAVTAGVYVYVFQGYKSQVNEDSLNRQISVLESRLQQKKDKDVEQAVAGENIISTCTSSEDGVPNYYLGLVFDYPSDWMPRKILSGVYGEDAYVLDFKGDLLMVGIKGDQVGDLNGGLGYCATQYKSIKEFCADKECDMINEHVAIGYDQTMFSSMPSMSMMVYTDLSEKYSSLCFNMDVSDVIEELSASRGVSYKEVLSDDSTIHILRTGEFLSEEKSSRLEDFRNLAKSIKRIDSK